MHRFSELYARAVERKGSAKVVEEAIPKALASTVLKRIGDDRWLSAMTRSVFKAGFVWRVVDSKWPAFEKAFHGFDLHAVAYLSEDDFGALLSDTNLIRHHAKMRAARDNAVFMLDLASEHGSAANFFADWPPTDFVGLLEIMKKRAARMGGTSAQYFFRTMGVDSFVMARDVIRVLIAEGVVTKPPSAKRDLRAVQDAFNVWCDESGRGLTAVSRVLAMSTD